MELIFFGLLASIVSGAAADVYRRAKRHIMANVTGIIGIVGFITAVAGMDASSLG